MDTDQPVNSKQILQSILERIEHLDASIMIAMDSESRRDDPLIKSWLTNLRIIDVQVRELLSTSE